MRGYNIRVRTRSRFQGIPSAPRRMLAGRSANLLALALFLSVAFPSSGCQREEAAPPSRERKAPRPPAPAPAPAAAPEETAGDLTPFEMEHGIGPVKERIEMASVRSDLVQQGRQIFEEKCTICHRLDERFIGPAMRGITDRRSPEYILNMILNPDEMARRHPVAQQQLQEYVVPMTYQDVSMEDALAILDYLRSVDSGEAPAASR